MARGLYALLAEALDDLRHNIVDDGMTTRGEIERAIYEIADSSVPASNADKAQCLLDDRALGHCECGSASTIFDAIGLAIYERVVEHLNAHADELRDERLEREVEEAECADCEGRGQREYEICEDPACVECVYNEGKMITCPTCFGTGLVP